MDAKFKAIQETQETLAYGLYGTQSAKYKRTLTYFEKFRSAGMATRRLTATHVSYTIFEGNIFKTATFSLDSTDFEVVEVPVGEAR